MKVAVINEISARDKNNDIINALKKVGVKPVNVGMVSGENKVELTYIHTGLMAGILLNLGAVDMVIGGCGTGQGFLVSAMQYPSVFCGLVNEPLDAWLFSQINGGNAVSLALNKGYGWAGNINLEYVFDKLFKDERGRGYPPERADSQRQSRERLANISMSSHKSMQDILCEIDKSILDTIFSHNAFAELIKGDVLNKELQEYIIANYLRS